MQNKSRRALFSVALATMLLALPACNTPSSISKASLTKQQESMAVEKAVAKAGNNSNEIARAAREVPVAQREGLVFLLDNMPERDLRTLSAPLLLENISLAYAALAKAPWRDQVPKEIFLNDILPYASINEKRDDWRNILREKCLPLVEDCRTPAEAAQRINQKLFKLTNVRYSTERKKADQSPLETMESGIATCTGLSVLLIDACRSVGVPARIVGTPLWTNLRGNHTWVEIWDGDWHFTGAAEPDAKGLDRGWFKHDASQARKDLPLHAIYASSFRKTGLTFPMVWAPDVQWVSAVNVTDNYTPKVKPAEAGKTRLLVKVLDRPAGQRVAAKITVTETTNPAMKFEGASKDESADMNDILPFEVARDSAYEVLAELGGKTIRKNFRTGTNAQEMIIVLMNDTSLLPLLSQACHAPLPPVKAAVESKFPCPENEIVRYTAYHIREPIKIDGHLDEPAWQNAPRSPRFIDILTGQPTLHDTRVTLLWDDENLYLGYRVEEPLVHAKYTNHNDPIYYDNDVEFFIAGRDAYYEFEINAFNTAYEVLFIWNDAYEKGGFAQAPEFNRAKLVPFNGVGLTNHPRGGRLGQFDWTFPGKKTAIAIDGTVNNDTDRDRGWTVELAFPWKGLAWLAKAERRPLPPKEGDVWRMDFSRFNTYKAPPPAKDSGGWVLSRHGIWDSHIPECFPYIRFTTNEVPAMKSAEKK